jgi:predicted secreted protein
VTNHDSPNAVKEFVAGLIDAGEFNIEGNHIAADAGQQALLTHLVARDARAVTITWPDASTLKGNVYCTKYAAGEAKVDGALPFSATLKWASSPTMAYS